MPISGLALAASSALLAGSMVVGASMSLGGLASGSLASGQLTSSSLAVSLDVPAASPAAAASPASVFADRLELAEEQASMLAFERFADVPVGGLVEVTGLPIGGGETIDMDMERITVLAPGAEVIEVGADGIERDMGPQLLVLLRGAVRGDADSTVVLGISPDITNGHIEAFGQTLVVTSGPVGGDAGGLPLSIAPLEDIRFDGALRPGCGYDPTNLELNRNALPEEIVRVDGKPGLGDEAETGTGARTETCRIAMIAIDTDFEYTSRLFGGNTAAAAAYAQTLIAAISEIYERDFNTRLLIPYLRTFSSNNDPYENSGDSLAQLVNAWTTGQGGYGTKTLVHLLSGRTNLPYGGVAYLSALCNGTFGFGVSAYLDGSFPYPLTDFSFGNWDLIVVAHELGHNFGTAHTHDGYDPVIDRCGIDCSGNRTSTIMSYCHICAGGLSNIRLGFHPRVIANVTDYLENRACDLSVTDEIATIDDEASVFAGQSVDIDVLGNDLFGGCSGLPMNLASFDAVSPGGGTIEMVDINGLIRPLLRYTAPTDASGGADSFTYTTDAGLTGTVNITIEILREAEPVDPLVLSPGVRFTFYDTVEPLLVLPDFDTLTPAGGYILPYIDFPSTDSVAGGSFLSDNVATLYEGFIFAPEAGVYTFSTSSNDGSALYIGDRKVVDNDGRHNRITKSGQIGLEAGYHSLRVEYFEAVGSSAMTVSWELPDGSFGVTPGASYFHGPDCPADITGEGDLNIFDVLGYLDLFDAQDPAADLAPDGTFDIFDVLAYLAEFDAGC